LFADPPVTATRMPDGAPASDRVLAIATMQSQMRLLVADDDEISREVLSLLLGRLDRRADFAGDGVEALAAVHGARYDVVLMDIQMPGMDGLEATRRIRSECSETQQPAIVAMTARVTVEDRALFLKTGMDDILPKPIRLNELAGVLDSYGSSAHMI
jgi:CheY-like chemotaxis protein